MVCSSYVFFINNPDPKMYRFKKSFCDVKMICNSNVFFMNNPDPEPDPKLMLKPDPEKKK
jgi:hypothetical protein